ncbi:DUF72 domain-containing protein [Mucilaginibacter sp. dw_454]|uniref:DUF72 domain-containing protein n=1 Tax=Mucilaginibacter sp. dw_454 TaxID=2720079 RepID=UPI001BD1BEEC|nr:DUF72 domain-containing protein [Mucilaginibacter sp. dw_454]
MNARGQAYYAGTSGLVLPVPNKLSYPPEFQDQPRLVYYAALFNSIEINSSFYKIPQAATLRKWADLVPSHFRFTFKLWKGITHEKGLQYAPADLDRFINAINAVGAKKGALLVQFPPSVREGQFLQINNLLNEVRNAAPDWDVAVEFRHPSLYADRTDQLLTGLNMSLVIHDLPASASPQEPLNLPFVYLRFHGPNGGYRGSYDDAFLNEQAHNIREWMEASKRVYVYFNNTMGAAVDNLGVLNGEVGAY